MDAELLNEVFRFPHKHPSTSQNEATCGVLATYFREFVEIIEPVRVVDGVAFSTKEGLRVPLHQVEERELAELKRACAVLAGRDENAAPLKRRDVWVEKWFPEYGCALLMEMVSAANVALKLVFLDGWKHVLHCLPEGKYVHSAVPTEYPVLDCGRIKPSVKKDFMASFYFELRCIRGESAHISSRCRNNQVKHHKTPQFIASLMLQMIEELEESHEQVVSRGGTTDVGLHTEGSYRDTCWPLVQGVIAQHLPGAGILFEKGMLLFKIHLLEAKVNALGDSDGSCTDLEGLELVADAEDAFVMLQDIGLQAVDLAQQGFDACAIEARCSALRDGLLSCLDSGTKRSAALKRLPSAERLEEIAASMRYPTIERLEYENHFKKSAVRSYRDAYVREQLGFLEYVDPHTCSPASLIDWLEYLKTSVDKENVVILALRTVEAFVFAEAPRLQDESNASAFTSDEVRELVRLYDDFVVQWSKMDFSDAVFDVEQRSRELLLKWIAFCLVHQNSARSCPLVREYGIALCWTDLRVAVLRDRAALSALSEAASYIRAWNRTRWGKPLFDLNRQIPTLHFARAFALRSDLYLRRYADSVHELEGRVDAKWKEIECKKAEVATLRSEIYDLKVSVLSLKKQLDGWEPVLWMRYQFSKGNDTLADLALATKEKMNDLVCQMEAKERALKSALEMPRFVTNPLPKSREQALEVLFLLEMPREIALLSELCFTAQSALTKADAQNLVESIPCPTWTSHHNENSSVISFADAVVVACPQSLSKPGLHGPPTVDCISTRADFERKCVWYPPGDIQLFWRNGVNPFEITPQMTIEFYTHLLPSEFDNFQWAIAYPGGEERGNLVYSKVLEQYLDGFDQCSFIVFGLLRAFPNQQIRKLGCAVKDNLLPWSHPCVGAVIRQAVYQVGELTNTATPVSWWKTDIQGNSGLAIFCSALDRAADQLMPSPRNYEDVPILSELAAYTWQWTSAAQPVVSKFVTMCRRWASSVEKQYRNNRRLSSEEMTALRAHECLLFGYALQSYTLGDCQDASLFEIGKLLVLFRNSMFFSAESERWGALKKLEVATSETMARRIHSVVGYFVVHPQELTSLLKLVNTGAPTRLEWSLLKPTENNAHSSSCFKSFDTATKTHYSVNLLTGIVLTDGNTPGGLPVQIRTSERFRELFEEQDFEVILSKGVYQTAHRIGECYFHFMLGGGDGFRLREVYLDNESRIGRTFVLCEPSWIAAIRDHDALPHRVRTMHSLWYWVEAKCILARPRSAFEKDVAFVLTFDDHDNAKCFAIPNTDQQCRHQDILERLSDYDCIVRIDDELMQVVERFEDEAFIHALRAPDGRLKLSFPRFRLNFVQNATTFDFQSLEYADYVLDQEQQFGDAFPNFQRYLVLRLTDETALAKPKIRILVPLGVMIKTDEGMVDVELLSAPSADLEFTVLDVHRRLETLSTESITARLHLCALLASTGTSIPSQCFKMTGAQAALQVLQGCHSSHPFQTSTFGCCSIFARLGTESLR